MNANISCLVQACENLGLGDHVDGRCMGRSVDRLHGRGGHMKAPAISVVMAAWNAEETVGEAVRSILGQTFADFELIVVDDGSEDDTARVVAGFGDDRIHLIANPRNLGLAAALNVGLAAAQGGLSHA